jgi:hypothetical protein
MYRCLPIHVHSAQTLSSCNNHSLLLTPFDSPEISSHNDPFSAQNIGATITTKHKPFRQLLRLVPTGGATTHVGVGSGHPMDVVGRTVGSAAGRPGRVVLPALESARVVPPATGAGEL